MAEKTYFELQREILVGEIAIVSGSSNLAEDLYQSLFI
jgi:hypothetical protein